MYLLYNVVTLLAAVVLAPWFAAQALRHGKYLGSLRARLGQQPPPADTRRSIWIQAVSVGEVMAARPLVAELKRRYPGLRLVVSTTTRTGQEVAARLLTEADAVIYFPLDWPFAVRRTFDAIRPQMLVMVENEMWPNVLRECHARGVRTAVVNGRLSARSFRRYRLVRPLFRRVLTHVQRFCVQDDETRGRLLALGADAARITITGSLKFDAADPAGTSTAGAPRLLRLLRVPEGRLVLIAGSTMRGEDPAVLRAFAALRATPAGKNALLILAPRHPERFGEVAALCRDAGLDTVLRTALPPDATLQADAVVLDTMGELVHVYRLADVVFVGGSLVPTGGHNILEPAVHGKPIVIGPYMHNFAEITATFLAHQAILQVGDDRELEEVLCGLAQNPVRRASLGAAARALVEANRGAKARTLAVLHDLLPRQDRKAVVTPFRVVD